MTIKVFSTTHCPACKKAKEYLDTLGVNYESINIEEDMEAQQQVISMGFYSVPVIMIGEEYIAGFSPNRISELLKK